MSTSSPAVFLSYASQDAEAARRFCETLRGAGVEVWFDQEGGLEHGDEWDVKIRRQIKDCVLFIPLISANTEARHEGYFRIEWELAAQRAMGIAHGVPFILPVVIDDTKDTTALVPDRFLKVQWMRLPGGIVPPEVLARLLKLWSHRTGVIKNEAAGGSIVGESVPRVAPKETTSDPSVGGSPPNPSSRRVPALVALAVGVVVIAGSAWWLTKRGTAERSVAAGASAQSAASPTAAPLASDAKAAPVGPPASAVPGPPKAGAKPSLPSASATAADQLAQQALALTSKLGFLPDDLAVAAELARKATDMDSGSGYAWGVRAWVEASYILRNWDRSAKRCEEAQANAKRALSINPDQTEALDALAQVMLQQGAYAEAESFARHATAISPNHYRSQLNLARAEDSQGRFDESRATILAALKRDPTNVLIRYELAVAVIGNTDRGISQERTAVAIEQLNAIMATHPFASAVVLRARIAASLQGDLRIMRAQLDRLEKEPLSDRTEDRAVYVAAWGSLLERHPPRALAALALTAKPYFEDSIVACPKAWLSALAQRVAGRENLARIEWQKAEAVLQQRLRTEAEDHDDTARLATTLAWLGRSKEAAKAIEPFEAAAREQPTLVSNRLLAQYYAAIGDAAKAQPYIKEALGHSFWVTIYTLRLDPWWDKLRGHPEFEAFVAK